MLDAAETSGISALNPKEIWDKVEAKFVRD